MNKTTILFTFAFSLFTFVFSFAQENKIDNTDLTISSKAKIPNSPLASLPNIQIKDEDNPSNILLEIIDEGPAASLVIPSLPSNISGSNKLYNVASTLYWNGSPLGTSGNAGGWNNTPTKVHLENNTDEVGIGTTSPSDKLHIVSETGQNPLRIQINSATKLRVLSNGGTSIGTNNTSPPENGLYVLGNVLSDGVVTGISRVYAKGDFLVGSNGSNVQGIKKITGTTSSNTNTSQIVFPSGFDWINTQVIALKIKDGSGKYKAISMDANDAFSLTLSPLNDIELTVPNNDFRNKLYQIVLMRIDD